MFEFVSKSDEEIREIQNRELLPEGNYPFIVKEMTAGESKSGNPMLTVRIAVIDNDGNARNIFDYLLSTEKMIYKLKHFCEAIGMEEDYKANKIDPIKCIERGGYCVLGVQKGGMKLDGSGFYPDKNQIKDYMKPADAPKPVVEQKEAPDFNDDIPF